MRLIRILLLSPVLMLLPSAIPVASLAEDAPPASLLVGFGETDITPEMGSKPVYMAGFGQNRKAESVHDPLMARAVVLKDGQRSLALVSVDVVGLSHELVLRIRKELPGISYVLISSTHNHEGPDTIGLWGPSPFANGVDPDYMRILQRQIVHAVRQAESAARPVSVRIGMAKAPELLHDGREPYVKHDELVALEFTGVKEKSLAGILVQWNCHPETLGGQNKRISADYVYATVDHLRAKYHCPVAYFTGTVGGLMTSLHVEVKDEKGTSLQDGTFEKTDRYGRLLGQVADRALSGAKTARLTPFTFRSRDIYLRLDNKLYQVARQTGVLVREVFHWAGDLYSASPLDAKDKEKRPCLRTEVAWLRLGELDVACIPGEIYPELVLDKVQDPPDPGADFPNAPIEPAIYKQLQGPYRMLIGLANDEIGYIIPKRQWDEKPPYCYGRNKAQYGEVNSLGPDTAPLICRAFEELTKASR